MEYINRIRRNSKSLFIILGANLSWLLVLAIHVIAYGNYYSEATSIVILTLILSIALSLLYPAILPCFFPIKGKSEASLFSSAAFCHIPFFIAWLTLFEFPLPGDIKSQPIIGIVMGGSLIMVMLAQWQGPVFRVFGAFSSIQKFFSNNPHGKVIKKRGPWVILPLLVIILYACFSSFYLSIAEFDDGCEFGGDVWEYQSIAVNFAKGHGFPVFGGIEPFATYKFGREQEKDQTRADIYRRFHKGPLVGKKVFYRTPGYILFLGLIYKYGDISPLAVKRIQLKCYAAIAALLPLVGFIYWRWHGALAGVISGSVFLDYFYWLSTFIMVENGSAICVMLIILAFILWEKRTTVITSIILGIVIGLSFLVKGAFLFLVPILGFYFFLLYRKRKITIRHVLAVLMACFFTILPWSWYATMSSKQLIIFSTQVQGSVEFLQNNNEMSLKDGLWHMQGPDQPDSIYQHPEVKNLSWPIQLGIFMMEYSKEIPSMIRMKVNNAFNTFDHLKLALLFIAFELVNTTILQPYRRKNKASDFPKSTLYTDFIPWILASSLVVSFFTGKTIIGILFLNVSTPLFIVASLLGLSILTRRTARVSVPPIFLILFLNYFCVTLLFFGYHRYMWPIAFIFVLLAFRYMIYFLLQGVQFLLDIRNSSSSNITTNTTRLIK